MDDFPCSSKNKTIYYKVGDEIRKRLNHLLNKLRIIRKFNGFHANQTKDYKIFHCKAYIEHIFDNNGWMYEFIEPVQIK